MYPSRKKTCYNNYGDKMYLVIKGKKIPVQECTTRKEKFKSFRFVLEPIKSGLKLSPKKLASTDFFCQRVDICFTDKNNKIIALYENVRSEKRILKLKSKNIYYLPLGTCKNLVKGELLKEERSK